MRHSVRRAKLDVKSRCLTWLFVNDGLYRRRWIIYLYSVCEITETSLLSGEVNVDVSVYTVTVARVLTSETSEVCLIS